MADLGMGKPKDENCIYEVFFSGPKCASVEILQRKIRFAMLILVTVYNDDGGDNVLLLKVMVTFAGCIKMFILGISAKLWFTTSKVSPSLSPLPSFSFIVTLQPL